MSGNLGQTSLRRRRRGVDPMRAYDGLPGPVRNWLANAALPWSPASAQRVWKRARAKGLGVDDALGVLDRCEIATLNRDRHALGEVPAIRR